MITKNISRLCSARNTSTHHNVCPVRSWYQLTDIEGVYLEFQFITQPRPFRVVPFLSFKDYWNDLWAPRYSSFITIHHRFIQIEAWRLNLWNLNWMEILSWTKQLQSYIDRQSLSVEGAHCSSILQGWIEEWSIYTNISVCAILRCPNPEFQGEAGKILVYALPGQAWQLIPTTTKDHKCKGIYI